MDPITLALINAAVVLGVAYGGTRTAMNGIHRRLERIESKLDASAIKDTEQDVRLAKIEVILQ